MNNIEKYYLGMTKFAVDKWTFLSPPGVDSAIRSLGGTGIGDMIEREYAKSRDTPDAIDTQTVNNLNSIKSELAKELGIKNLDVRKADSIDAAMQGFRKWDADSPGVFSNYDANSGKKWGLKGVGSVDVPVGLQWLAGAANRVGNTVGSFVGNVAHSGGQVVSRGHDALAQDNPTIYVYPDGTYDLYDSTQHWKELGGHGALTAANVLSFGVGGKVIGGVGKGAVGAANKMGANLAGKLSPSIMQRLGINATGQFLRTTARNATGAAIKKLPTSWRGPAVTLANVTGKAVKPALTVGALGGSYHYAGNKLNEADERMSKIMTSPAWQRAADNTYAGSDTPTLGSTPGYTPPPGYFDNDTDLPSPDGSSVPKWLLPSLLVGGGGLALYNMMGDSNKPTPRLSKEELEDRKRKRRAGRNV